MNVYAPILGEDNHICKIKKTDTGRGSNAGFNLGTKASVSCGLSQALSFRFDKNLT